MFEQPDADCILRGNVFNPACPARCCIFCPPDQGARLNSGARSAAYPRKC